MAYHKIIITILWLAISIMGFPKYISKIGQISNRKTGNFIYSNIQSNINIILLKQWSEKGNVLATLLYSTASDMTLQQAKCNLSAVILNKSHTALAYADSIGTLSHSKAQLQKTFNWNLIKKKKKFGLIANCEKTKIMKLITQNFTLKINNNTFAIAEEFKYLGSTVSSINNTSNTIWHWILFSNKCYFSSINVLKSENISRATSSKLYKAVTCSAVMYGAEQRLAAQKTHATFFPGRILRIIFRPVLEDNQ